MSKFDYVRFTGGADDEFVVNAQKHGESEVIPLFIQECWTEFLAKRCRKPTVKDIHTNEYVRWYVRVPEQCSPDISEGGCYSYCGEKERGSFPVYSIKFEELLLS